jgi:hypothetical protein
MIPNGLRAQYLIPNLSLNAIAYPSIHSFRSNHVITQSRKISANNFLAERKPTADRELLCRIFLERPSFSRTDFFTKLGPQIRLLPVPNFGVNSYAIRGSRRNDSAATPRAANNNSSTLMTRCVPLMMQDNCATPDCFLVESSRHCGSQHYIWFTNPYI